MIKQEVLIIVALLFANTERALANGGSRPAPQPSPVPRRAVLLKTIPDRYIEMPAVDQNPDQTLVYAFGKNITDRLVTALSNDGRFIVRVDTVQDAGLAVAASTRADSDPVRFDDPVTASVEFTGTVKELSFETGERGDRTYYGFRPSFRNKYNAGIEPRSMNEYAGVFSEVFGDTGGLHDGMDIGSEVNLDLFWIGVSLKRAHYSARMSVEFTFFDAITRSFTRKVVTARGDGLFFELVGQYAGYMAGIMAARRAAMNDAFNNLMGTLAQAVASELVNRKILYEAHNVGSAIYIAGGSENGGLVPGLRFYNSSAHERGEPVAVLEVDRVYRLVSSLRVLTPAAVHNSDLLASLASGETPPRGGGSAKSASVASASTAPVTSREVQAPQQDYNPIRALLGFLDNTIGRFFRGLAALVTLPFRIARFFQYDQDFSAGEMWRPDLARLRSKANGNWALQSLGAESAWANGLGDNRTIVAVLDSGVDYNHQELRRNIFFDGPTRAPGYDFYSMDSRPFDDHAHGTAVAGAIAGGGWRTAGAAPYATILPVKVFSPYGLTSSAALYGGVEYAIEHGARIIVMGWSSETRSEALLDAIRLARFNSVLVIAAAGDDGVDLGSKPRYPASLADEDPSLDNLLVVAGLDQNGRYFQSDGPLRLSSNSGGPAWLAAPASGVLLPSPRNGYVTAHYSGVAAGFAAGAAALALAANPTLTPAQIVDVIRQSSEAAPQINARRLKLPGIAARAAALRIR